MNLKRPSRNAGSFTGIAHVLFIVSLILAAVILFALLSGCSNRSVIQIDPRLTAPVERPVLLGPTNRDIWVYALQQQQAIEEYEERMRLLRELSR